MSEAKKLETVSQYCRECLPPLECDNCFAHRLIRERDEALAEVQKLRGVDCGVTELNGTSTPLCGICLECAFKRGAEAMREAAMGAAWHSSAMALHRRIKEMPIPEDEP